MNAKRKIKLGALKIKISDIKTSVSEIRKEEQTEFDNLSAGLKATDRGDAMEDTIDYLQEVETALGEVVTNIEEILNR